MRAALTAVKRLAAPGPREALIGIAAGALITATVWAVDGAAAIHAITAAPAHLISTAETIWSVIA